MSQSENPDPGPAQDARTSQPIWIQSTGIHHYAAVRPDTGFKLENLSPGLNLIHGPNGCGKSTTANALRDLLWPADHDSYALLQAKLHQGDAAWNLERQGTTRQIHPQDGSASEPPLSPPETRSRYVWTLRDLLSETDGDLAARVAREMAGGVDFHALEKKIGANGSPAAPRKLQDEYRRIETRLREAKQAQRNLQSRARDLDTLRNRMQVLEKEAGLVSALELALERIELRRQLEASHTQVNTFPPNMDHLQRGDADRARQAVRSRQDAQQEQEHVKRQRVELEQHEPDWRAFATDDLRQALRKLERSQRDLDDAARTLEQTTREVTDQETLERQVRNGLGISSSAAEQLTTGHAHPELRAWIRLVLRERSLTAETESLRGRLPDDDAGGPGLEELRNTRRELERATTELLAPFPKPTPAGITAWLTLTGVMLALRDQISSLLFLLLLLPPATGLLVHLLRRNNQLSELRKRVEPTFRLPEPLTAGALREALTHLDTRIREAYALDLAGEDRNRLDTTEARLQEIRAEMEPLTAQIRETDADVDAEWLAHFLEDVQTWRSRREHLALAESRMSEAEAAHADALNTVETIRKAWDTRVDADGLTDRLRNEIDRRASLETMRVKAEALSGAIARADHEQAEICGRNQLAAENWEELLSREEKLSAWEEVQQNIRIKTDRVRELDDKLADHPEWRNLEREELETRLEHAQEAGRRAREEFGVITELEVDIRNAKEGRDVHRLREELERKRRELEADRAEAAELRLKHEILGWLKDSVRENRRPEVLNTANRHLARFTNGGLELTLSFEDGVETFRAGRPGHAARTLDTLSGGERAQLLMAVRLAFLDQQESAPLPLFVDEALGTSDDDRAEAILNTLIHIARQGRQVFYFTAQTDEVGKWLRALEHHGRGASRPGPAQDAPPPYTIIDLGALRAGNPAVPLDIHPLPESDVGNLTRNPGESDADWAQRLGVPHWHPHHPIEDVPLFLLLREQDDSLVRCLEHGLTTWGALDALIQADVADTLVDPDTLPVLQARAAALKALAGAWRIGHPEPVPPELILQSDSVSDTFQEPILHLLRNVDFQAEPFLAELENKAVPRWRQDNTDALRALLREHGHLTDTEPLSTDDLRAQAYATLKDTPHAEHLKAEDLRFLTGLL